MTTQRTGTSRVLTLVVSLLMVTSAVWAEQPEDAPEQPAQEEQPGGVPSEDESSRDAEGTASEGADDEPPESAEGVASDGAEESPLADSESAAAENAEDAGVRIVIAAGWQMVTRERLEVLSLFSDRRVSEGLSLAETVDAIHDSGGIPVAPWGVGKWIGRRGDILRKYLRRAPMPFWLGDNGGRPRFWPTPGLFRIAAHAGIGVLSGSDPLPLRADRHRAGSYGFRLSGSADPHRPAEMLRHRLQTSAKRPAPYGRRMKTLTFLVRQLQLRYSVR